tara:strand:+ start:451 stop:882 length:432 start_codon:yes stop_codon:yes gene_type:complete
MAKMQMKEINEKIEQYIAGGTSPSWFIDAYNANVTNLNGGVVSESQFTTSVTGLCRSLTSENPLMQRRRATLSPARQERVNAHAQFLIDIAEAFDSIPEGETLVLAKISKVRPTGVYVDGADFASVFATKIESAAKALDKEDN